MNHNHSDLPFGLIEITKGGQIMNHNHSDLASGSLREDFLGAAVSSLSPVLLLPANTGWFNALNIKFQHVPTYREVNLAEETVASLREGSHHATTQQIRRRIGLNMQHQ
ncbi:hypothetical protein RRG08_066415 [Elysia crispata]|uniref:Uncharacterized protein n=1 Tax=Elysia crispata TaxID=231223 RepID=A0AAE0Y4K6_9GAST|nr:hypothetical protein RRG08_066415 [Elysia crispata]